MTGLGAMPPGLLREVGAGLAGALGIAWRPGPPLDRPAYAFNEVRGQYNAPAVLRRLAGLRSGPRSAVLGLVAGDLFVPDDGNYVLGDADRAAWAALVGLGRLGSDPAELARRAQLEALHELGHVIGLSGCGDPRCAMSPARFVGEVDRKELAFCVRCRAALIQPLEDP